MKFDFVAVLGEFIYVRSICISFKTSNILCRAHSIFVGRQVYYLHACVGTKDIRRLHEAAISAPREEIAEFGESKARACG